MADRWFDAEAVPRSLNAGNALSILGDIPKRANGFAEWLGNYKTRVQGVPSADKYLPTYNLMKPVVERLQEFHDFIGMLTSLFSEHLQVIAGNHEATASVCVVLKVMDIVAVLNFLKMFCSALMNDFAMFKRSFQQIRTDIPGDESELVAQQSHTLHFFLANPNSIVDEMKHAASQIQGFEMALLGAVNVGTQALGPDGGRSLPDAERCGLQRAALYSLAVAGDSTSFDVFRQRSSGIKAMKQIVRENPDVQVYNTLSLNCLVVLKSCRQFGANEREWIASDDALNFGSCVCL